MTNPDGTQAVLPYRYLIETTIQPDVAVGLGGPRVLTPGSTGTYSFNGGVNLTVNGTNAFGLRAQNDLPR